MDCEWIANWKYYCSKVFSTRKSKSPVEFDWWRKIYREGKRRIWKKTFFVKAIITNAVLKYLFTPSSNYHQLFDSAKLMKLFLRAKIFQVINGAVVQVFRELNVLYFCKENLKFKYLATLVFSFVLLHLHLNISVPIYNWLTDLFKFILEKGQLKKWWSAVDL